MSVYWMCPDKGWIWKDKLKGDEKPVLVIDSSDPEVVCDLTAAFWRFQGPGNSDQEAMLKALRSLENPRPKITEPTGLGAVVEDEDGQIWVRIENHSRPWYPPSGGELDMETWARIAVVKVLSQGWEPA